MADISSQLNQKYDELRNIGNELATLVGREPKFPRKRANTHDEDAPPARRDIDRRISYESNDRKISYDGNSDRKVISYEQPDRKRSRLIEDEPPRRSDHRRNDDDDHPPSRRPTLQSSVRMPMIETKSREEVLAERKNNTGADGARNRRMFGNLLLGTLKQFQKEEKAPELAPKTQAQHDKLKEVEERLEKSVRQDKEKYLQDKKAVEMKLREKEMEIKRLKQRQAIQAKNENKIAHYKRLQNFIQTETKPPIFFLPARLTLRGMELLKQSSRNLENLIKERETEMQNELRELEDLSDGEIGPAIRSYVKVVSTDKDSRAHLKPVNVDDNMDEPLDDEDDDDDDLDEVFKVRSSVVVVKPDVAKNGDSEVKEEKNGNEKKKNGEEKDVEREPASKAEKEESKGSVQAIQNRPTKAEKDESKLKSSEKESKRDKEISKGDKEETKSKAEKDSNSKSEKDTKSQSREEGSKSKDRKDDSKGGEKEKSKQENEDSKSKGRDEKSKSKKDDREESKSKAEKEGKKVSSKKHGSASPSD